ncbi:MAG: hypothetical protein AB1899_05340 [Pseudomonadota bacterium]
MDQFTRILKLHQLRIREPAPALARRADVKKARAASGLQKVVAEGLQNNPQE